MPRIDQKNDARNYTPATELRVGFFDDDEEEAELIDENTA